MTPPAPAQKTLRHILLVPLLILVCLFFLAVTLLVLIQNQRMLVRQTEHQAQTILEAIQGALEVSRDPLELQRQITVIGGERQIKGISVALSNPIRIVASTRHAWLGKNLDDIPQQEEVKPLRQVLREGGRLALQRDDPPEWQFVGEISLTNTSQATGQPIRGAVSVVLDAGPIRASQRQSMIILLLAMALVLGLGALFTWRLLRRHVIAPVETMAEAVALRARGDDGVRIPVQADDEIGMLGRALNTLLDAEDQAQQRVERERALAQALFNLHAGSAGQSEGERLASALKLAMDLCACQSGRILVRPPGGEALQPACEQGRPQHECRIDIEEQGSPCLRLELGDKPRGFDEDDARQARYIAHEAWQILRRRRMDLALQDADARFRRMIETTLEGVWIFDGGLRVTYANQRTCAMLGFALEQMLGHPVIDFIPPEEIADHQRQMDLRLAGKGAVYERRFLRADGSTLWCLVSASPMLAEDGSFQGSFAMLSDISRIKETEEALKLAAHVYDDSPNAIAITDASFRVQSVNQAYTQITGFTPEETLGRPAAFLDQEHKEEWLRLPPGGRWQGEIWNQRKSGERYPEWLSLSPVSDGGRITHYVAIISDLTERKEAESRIDYLASHDPLTGLPNRVLFQGRTDQALGMAAGQGRKAAVALLNLDRFKTINDSLGHAVGDALLVQAARRLETSLGQANVLCRQGGDEFLILLSEVEDASCAGQQAQRLLQVLTEPFHREGQDIQISASLGLALYPDDGRSFAELLPRADSAMRQAKESGRNTLRFYRAEMNSDALARLQLENSLREALAQGQFQLHYQPLVRAEAGQVCGVEALLRWPHPEQGMISPAQFIPLAEESGLIVPLGAWVLQEACRQARHWQDLGLPLRVAVNLSSVQFKRGDLVATVREALEETGLDPARLELELTESILIQDVEETLETVHQLRALGLELSIDDFGTGYSSLAYLRRLPVHKLKIDQSFVRYLTEKSEDAAIVSTILAMARQLNLETVAEGVETQAQYEWLKSRGCTTIQGYYFSRPLPAPEIPAQIERIRP